MGETLRAVIEPERDSSTNDEDLAQVVRDIVTISGVGGLEVRKKARAEMYRVNEWLQRSIVLTDARRSVNSHIGIRVI